MSEWQLLREYVENGSQAAFTELVGRYIDLVYSTCRREVQDTTLAEDVTQVVFLLLAKKAPMLREETVLSGWLFQTARFASKNALKQEARRQQREQKAVQEMAYDLETGEDASWGEIEPLLHSALSTLSPAERNAVLFRFFEGRSFKETGKALGISEDTAGKRVSRAVEKLRRYFSRNGFVLSGTVLSALLSDNAVRAAPAQCTALVMQAASSATTGVATAGAVGAKALSLYEGVARALLINQMRTAAGVLAFTALATISAGRLVNLTAAKSQGTQTVAIVQQHKLVQRGLTAPRFAQAAQAAPAIRSKPAIRFKEDSALSRSRTSFVDSGAKRLKSNEVGMLDRLGPEKAVLSENMVLSAGSKSNLLRLSHAEMNREAPTYTTTRRATLQSTDKIKGKQKGHWPAKSKVLGTLFGVAIGQSTMLSKAQPPDHPAVAPPADAAKPVVVNTEDNGPGSLRQALTLAAKKPGTTITFKIPEADPGNENGVFVIETATSLPVISADGTVIDGASQTTFAGDTNKSGPEIVISGNLPTKRRQGPQGVGLAITGANCVIQSLVLNSFSGGIFISGPQATGNQVRACYIGTNASGMSALGTTPFGLRNAAITTSVSNFLGIAIDGGANNNIVGGANPADRNVISGNMIFQVEISGAGTDGNIVQGNYIGVAADGETAIPLGAGVSIEDGSANNIIGQLEGARNVIVGYGQEGYAVRIRHKGSDANVVQGNYLGTDKDGMKLLGTGFFGVLINQSAEHNLVGGTAPGARNVIAGQSDSTVAITFANNNIVQGNYIGTNATGTAALGKAASGVCIYTASSNLVGGDTGGARNVISGNCKRGVLLLGEGGGDTANNIVQGNYIGTDATGKVGVGNQLTGVGICGVVNNTVGLALDGTGAGNRIAFNKGDGVRIYLVPNVQAAARNMVRGNEIYGNDGLGINLQPEQETNGAATLNDDGDADGGPNNGQNFPIITEVATADGKTSINGILESTPNTKFIIDFYHNTTADPSKYGEGEEHLGSSEVTTDAAGNATLNFRAKDKLEDGFFTATATNLATGDTSEFGENVKGNT